MNGVPFGPEAGGVTSLLGPEARAALDAALDRCGDARFAARIAAGDHTLWSPDPSGVADRLGWLRAPELLRPGIGAFASFADEVREQGVKEVVLLGMGGSSLAPEVFATIFGSRRGHPRLSVLDSTDPEAVLAVERRIEPKRTLFVVSSKSGGTVETLSLFKYFHALLAARLGAAAAGRHFVAITDPGSGLESAAAHVGARAVFLNEPDVGGRFSALTRYGLVPAALCGVDLAKLLGRADAMRDLCRAEDPRANPGVALGALLGGMALAGRDKLTLVCGNEVQGFGAWLEQLVAESTGKGGRGILPVDGETVGSPQNYGRDRLFVAILLAGDERLGTELAALGAGGHPVLLIRLRDVYDLGAEFYRWEMATAVAGFLLGVNPFDQPDVESAKVQAGHALAAFREQGALPLEPLTLEDGALGFSGGAGGGSAGEALRRFLGQAAPGGYVALQAFLPPRPDLEQLLTAIQCVTRDRWQVAVTAGFGPRFLHSTGQLHKGGPAGGLYVQFTGDVAQDAVIPDRFGARAGAVTFGVLEAAQALGDRTALAARGRRVLRVHLAGDARAGLTTVLRILGRP